ANPGFCGGMGEPGHRYPGMKHSGKQITLAPRRAASATAAVARRTDSSRVPGTRTFARAIRTALIRLSRLGSLARYVLGVSWPLWSCGVVELTPTPLR